MGFNSLDVLIESMKANLQPNSASRSTAAQSSASVPISVYRELAAELQATKAMLDALNGKNQQLDHENQQLRQEMQRVVHSVLSLQPLINAGEEMQAPAPVPLRRKAQRPAGSERPSWEETAAATAMAAKLRTSSEAQADEWFTEEAPTPQRVSQTKQAANLGSVWLVLTVIVIIVSAFGAGFLVMRPFLPTK